MGQSVIERMSQIGADKKIADFQVKQKQDYDFKKRYAEVRAHEFVSECDIRGLNYHVSVGGLDSIALYLFLKSIGINAPGISVSHLEDKSIQKIHKDLGLNCLFPAKKKDGTQWNKTNIIQEFGFPVLSKEIVCVPKCFSYILLYLRNAYNAFPTIQLNSFDIILLLCHHKWKLLYDALIILDLGAGIICGIHGDYRKLIYWIAAAVLNTVVTF